MAGSQQLTKTNSKQIPSATRFPVFPDKCLLHIKNNNILVYDLDYLILNLWCHLSQYALEHGKHQIWNTRVRSAGCRDLPAGRRRARTYLIELPTILISRSRRWSSKPNFSPPLRNTDITPLKGAIQVLFLSLKHKITTKTTKNLNPKHTQRVNNVL